VLVTITPPEDPAKAPLLGLTSVLLGPMLLCHLQSLIFAVWILVGKRRQASVPHLQVDFDDHFPSSPHAPSPWADAIFNFRAQWSPVPPVLGLLAPVAAVSIQCFRGRRQSSAPATSSAALGLAL
ncbi:unnamed protein product, partial [Symbiodinium pilosum]